MPAKNEKPANIKIPQTHLKNYKCKLSVPLIAAYLKNGYSQRQIAQITNVTDGGVSEFIKRHNYELQPLINPDDTHLQMQAKLNAIKSGSLLEKSLNFVPTKKDMAVLNIVNAVQTEKYRLLSNQSTENIGIASLLSDLKSEKANIINELREITGVKQSDIQDSANISEMQVIDNKE